MTKRLAPEEITPKEHPVAIGNRTEAKVLAALLDRYDTVLLPYGGNSWYDLVVDTPEGFKRIQCKTGRLRENGGAVIFKTCSSTEHRATGTTQTYYGDADLFGVYCPDLQTVYLVPVEICGARAASLRVRPAKTGQVARTRPASDYQIS